MCIQKSDDSERVEVCAATGRGAGRSGPLRENFPKRRQLMESSVRGGGSGVPLLSTYGVRDTEYSIHV